MIWLTDSPDLQTLIQAGTYLICWMISEIPRLSHAAPEWHSSKYSVYVETLQSMSSIFSILVTNIGRFPELTPVRSQAIESWLATLEAGDTNHTRIVYKKLQSNRQMNSTQKEFPKR